MYSKIFEKSGAVMAVDFTNKRLIYPEEVTAERETTKNFHQPETLVSHFNGTRMYPNDK